MTSFAELLLLLILLESRICYWIVDYIRIRCWYMVFLCYSLRNERIVFFRLFHEIGQWNALLDSAHTFRLSCRRCQIRHSFDGYFLVTDRLVLGHLEVVPPLQNFWLSTAWVAHILVQVIFLLCWLYVISCPLIYWIMTLSIRLLIN